MDDAGCRASRGWLGDLQLGFCVWVFEMRWVFKNVWRMVQQRQLARRLREEHERLGRLQAGARDEEQMELARRQIVFLEEEIRRLEEDYAARRESDRSQRLREWGID
jgi:hypothetical protein